ncbi:MAG TPA: hypothetical protein VFL41_04545 [Gaiellaceae bacterium]|nr:hypothetical protein [Gaiellaceae bacterium]
MTALLDRLLGLWQEPVDERDDPEAAFREVYADPVSINGTLMPVSSLVERARALHRTIDILTIADGLITALWVVSDELGMLTQLDVVRLA